MPPPAVAGATEIYWAAGGLTLVALALIAWQVFDLKNRPSDHSPVDGRYFRNRDLRRWACALFMLLAAGLMFLAARIDDQAQGDRDTARLYVLLWIVILALIVAMLALALLDWLANRHYAARHRRALARERETYLSSLAEQSRQRDAKEGKNRPGNPPDPSWN